MTTILQARLSFANHSSDLCLYLAKLATQTLLRLKRERCALVGPSGLEPPTSCLSGTRSNLLSYEPMWLVWIFSHLNFSPSLSRKLLCLPFFSKKVSGGDEGIRLSRELRAQSFAALTIINRHSLPLLLRIPP